MHAVIEAAGHGRGLIPGADRETTQRDVGQRMGVIGTKLENLLELGNRLVVAEQSRERQPAGVDRIDTRGRVARQGALKAEKRLGVTIESE